MSIFQGQVGPETLSDGSIADIRMGKQGDTIVSELDPRYYEQVYRGNVYFAANQANVTFAAGLTLSAAVLGLVVSNPIGNNKNLIPLQIEFIPAATAIIGTAIVGVMPPSSTAITINTALNTYSALTLNTGTATAKASSGVTLPSVPVIWKSLMSIVTSTAGSAVYPQAILDTGGSVIVPPGGAVGIFTSTAQVGIASMTWLELPL